MESLKVPVSILIGLLLLCAIAFVFTRDQGTHMAGAPVVVGAATQVAPPSTEVMAYLAQSKGFQYLVSYTDNGFEPNTLTVQKGETVRFTNNSKKGMWIAADASRGQLYPSIVNGCGSSALDTCHTLAPGVFWEFTFDASGTWGYQNNADTSRTGSIVVQ